MRTKILIVLFFAFAIVRAQVGTSDTSSAHKGPVYFTNQQLPNLSFAPLHGKPFQLKDLKGKVIVMNWWFTTCSPCQEERPFLNQMVQKYKDDSVTFIAIAKNTEPELLKYLEKNPFYYQQTIATDEIISLFDYYFPRNVVIDRKGKVAGDFVGYAFGYTEKILDSTISNALKKVR